MSGIFSCLEDIKKGLFSPELSTCQMINRVQSIVEASGRIQWVGWWWWGQETTFKELCVSIVDACMLSPTLGL